jgi:hypothetical protein
MDIIAYGGTNSISSPQTTNVYLQDYSGSVITKQNLLDILLSEIWDERDGDILRHINNVQVDITRLSDNVLIDQISDQGYYSIKMSCEDSDGNVGTEFWQTKQQSLFTDYIKLLVRTNQPPVIFINDIHIFKLSMFNNSIITRSDLDNQMVYTVIDDRDGVIQTNILNVRIFQIGEQATAGTNSIDWFYPTYPDGTSGIIFQDVVETEILFINEIGEYIINFRVTDSDGASTACNIPICVYIT